ncbi:hypothetical protein FB561_2769 [Kribbella amoyensis]|uniref:Uncharacterized protein n=1 Tax=Kribbella amoyensis TaxID=996641 RepID=A0A561BS61_9ACTN|nr:hypothetical protein [Kribbella amoyensis]TWD81649.1 hypothetical protein FB561_2769 [Kribbella amoyensis]
MITAPCTCPCHVLIHHGTPQPETGLIPGASPGDELRAYQAIRELANRGIDAVPARDEHGHFTGLIAVEGTDLVALLDQLRDWTGEDQ